MVLKSGGGVTIFEISNHVCPGCGSRQTYAAFPPGLILFDKCLRRGRLVYEIHNYEGGADLCCFCSDCDREWPAEYTEREKQ